LFYDVVFRVVYNRKRRISERSRCPGKGF